MHIDNKIKIKNVMDIETNQIFAPSVYLKLTGHTAL